MYKEPNLGPKGGYSVLDQINFSKELLSIKQAIKESEQSISFSSMVATVPNFTKMLNKKPKVLHVSCHGISNRNQINFANIMAEGDFLLFENNSGQGELVSQ